MIVVTGATGQLGRAVVDHLRDRVPAEGIAVSVRDPQRFDGRGVRVRRGDYAEPATLDAAFEGASAVLIVSVDILGEEAIRLHRNAIDAAVASGAKRVLYTSHMGASPSSVCPPMIDHAATEDLLKDSGVAITSLRNGFYATTLPRLLQHAIVSGELRLPEDGPVAWTAHADLAEATARILVDDGFDGPTPPLTGPEAVDMAHVAAIASKVTGKAIRHVVVSDEEYRASLPEPMGDLMLSMFVASRHGDFGPADPALETLIGRPATSVEEYLRGAL
jgi:NAD(P)H dehydrogenase (quinone)